MPAEIASRWRDSFPDLRLLAQLERDVDEVHEEAGARGAEGARTVCSLPHRPRRDAHLRPGTRIAREEGMSERHIVIVGGGLAGLSAGCYARASGFRTTIVEHNLALGGVCTAWPRGPYVVDGCIHWLTGGAFASIYAELGIVPAVSLTAIKHWSTFRDAPTGQEIAITSDLAALERDLRAFAPEDSEEIARVVEGAQVFAGVSPAIAAPAEIASLSDHLRAFWEMRDALGEFIHFRKPLDVWAREHLKSERLQRLFTHLFPSEAPALTLLFGLGYLQRDWLSRPIGGTARFRDALIETYQRLGGESVLHATVDEILVERDRAQGVRLDDGTMIAADAVISTSSMPETVLRLLGGRYGADATRERMGRWKMFQPIVLASFGVDLPLADLPAMLVVDRVPPFEVGGFENAHVYLRICNDDTSLAPPGHAVIQAMLPTDYAWWATRGSQYQAAKDAVAEVALAQIESVVSGVRPHVRMTDVATPLTFWTMARSWRGAYEGWIPSPEAMFGHVPKTLPKLDGFLMAGQWVEPGGGVPMAVLSGRQVAQILCAKEGRPFVSSPAKRVS
jgi:phytoene dehydrogenase-like protein